MHLTRRADAWLAYIFDGAVFTFGRWCDAKLAQTDREQKPVHTLAGILADVEPKRGKRGQQGAGWAQARRYRNPADMVKVFG